MPNIWADTVYICMFFLDNYVCVLCKYIADTFAISLEPLEPVVLAVVLQCVAVCCSVLQCVAVCCSVLQCVAVCCSVLQCVAVSLEPVVLAVILEFERSR